MNFITKICNILMYIFDINVYNQIFNKKKVILIAAKAASVASSPTARGTSKPCTKKFVEPHGISNNFIKFESIDNLI